MSASTTAVNLGIKDLFERVPLPARSENEYVDLGYTIPGPLPFFVMTETTRKHALEVANRMEIGSKSANNARLKTIGWYGPPGTGKDTLAREIAAYQRLPFLEFDLGQGYDLLELIGGTGLRSIDGGTQTVAVSGPLTAAAAVGSIVALNEVVNIDGLQLSILHAMVQDRKIMLPTAEPAGSTGHTVHREIPVHPDTFFVFTWNPDLRNPDRQMPPPALLDRLRARRFDAHTPEEEAQKLVSILKYTLDQHVTMEAIRPDTRLIRELRQAYTNGHLARCPYMRTLEDFAMTRLTLGKEAAFEVLLNLCDQDPAEFEYQRKEVLERHFRAIFGTVP